MTLDNVKAGQMAAEHLLSLGHTRLAHIAGPQKLRLARERREGFERAIAARGLDMCRCVAVEDWACAAGYQGMKQIMREGPLPTGIFAASDRLAIGAMQAANEAGLRVPEDLSILGLDDIEVAAFQIPPLTTIRQSFTQLASLGLQILLDILSDREPALGRVVLEPALIRRQSTGPVRPSTGPVPVQ